MAAPPHRFVQVDFLHAVLTADDDDLFYDTEHTLDIPPFYTYREHPKPGGLVVDKSHKLWFFGVLRQSEIDVANEALAATDRDYEKISTCFRRSIHSLVVRL